MTDDDTRPSWLHESCPSWCTQQHAEDDHPEDRRHRNAGIVVAAVLADVGPDPGPGIATELVIAADRGVGSEQTWVFVGESEGTTHRLRLSDDSARRVGIALTATCAAVQD